MIVTDAHVLLSICICSNMKKQRFGVWTLNSVRISQGQFIYLTSGLQSDELFDYLRMRTSSLDALLSYVRNYLTRQTSDAQTPVPLEERLAEMQESSTLGRSRERSGRPTSCDNNEERYFCRPNAANRKYSFAKSVAVGHRTLFAVALIWTNVSHF